MHMHIIMGLEENVNKSMLEFFWLFFIFFDDISIFFLLLSQERNLSLKLLQSVIK